MNVLSISKLYESTGILRNRFKDFNQFPDGPQKALLDLQFNTGLPKRGWDNGFYKAINNKDWAMAAKESRRKDIDPARNKKIYDLFQSAVKTPDKN